MSHCDNSLFYRHTKLSITILLVYVDDILLTGNDSTFISTLLHDLNAQFAMRLLGPIKQFLGIDITYHSTGVSLSQQSYITKILQKAGMDSCKPNMTPTSTKKTKVMAEQSYSDPYFYRSLAGALQYVTITRPNITFAVNSVCQHMHQPGLSHF